MLTNSRLQSIVLTSRLAEAEEFYRTVLGLPMKEKADGAIVFDILDKNPPDIAMATEGHRNGAARRRHAGQSSFQSRAVEESRGQIP